MQPASAAEPLYNPATETESEEQVVASRWELLRRKTEFQAVAKEWIASESFRKNHSLTPAYCDFARLVPRCALDWMLTAERRAALAHFQIEKRTWQLGKHRNFGPIIWRFRNSAAAMSRKTAYGSIEVRPMTNTSKPISFNNAWDSVSEHFKRQFRFAVLPRKPSFALINETIGEAALVLGIIARKLQAGDPLHEMEIMAAFAFELGADLYQLAGNYRLYRIAHGGYSNSAFKGFLNRIKEDFSGSFGEISDGRKHDSHRSYLGTEKDWHWFLEAERLKLDIKKSPDLYRLAELYYDDLRRQKMRGQAHPRTKAHGHTGAPVSSKDKRNHRNDVRKHILKILEWIQKEYPPLPPAPNAAVS